MKLQDYHLWTALITPLKPGLGVDYKSLEKIISEQTEAKNGLLILGSTGEALNLDLDTRKKIVEFVLSLKPSSPVMVGVGGHDLGAQREWIKWLETKNIDAYLMVTPIYAKAGDEGQYLWFKDLMDKVSKPVMLYNVPGRAGSWLSFKAVRRLNSHPNFWAIKEAGGSPEKMKEYLKAANGGQVFCGDDGLMSEFAAAGSCGLVSVASNTWPMATHTYVKKCLNGSVTDLPQWKHACDTLFIASNPVPAKALMAMEGRIAHNTMMPPLASEDLKDFGRLKEANHFVNTWYKNNK
ncbi:MAG: 4-hydroxy-tetrahydrodipicolinate synthase [Halobacteriovoraceae bacterium]|nr:4-hydroxy-tetrahydrodipicolinate synthase [Halobacteriovoraceae bacterium]|tara:strand:- start:12152 stop:13033 length:882 start_codon:yes stop_codon:yes gene_type:complete